MRFDEDDEETDEPIEGCLLSEWVLVSSWMDPQDGQAYTVVLDSENNAVHHRRGLLHTALYEMHR